MERGGVTPFFFTNFPDDFNEEGLWRVFRRYGKVWDVFVARKRTQQGTRFGFVRFKDILNPNELEQQMNTIQIGNFKLRVNQPKYKRQLQPHNMNAVCNTHAAMNGGARGSRGGYMGGQGKASYAQVVQGGQPRWQKRNTDANTWRGIDIQVEETNQDWLNKCMVGRLIEPWHIMNIQEAFLLEGFTTIRIRYLGDNMVLLSGDQDDNLQDIFEGERAWLEKIFESVESWSPETGSGNRMAWIRAYGLPLQVWNPTCFSKVVATMGSLVMVDEKTTGMECLEYARFLIRTSSLSSISAHHDIRVNGQICTIRLFEELASPPCPCAPGERKVYEDDDSNASLVDGVEVLSGAFDSDGECEGPILYSHGGGIDPTTLNQTTSGDRVQHNTLTHAPRRQNEFNAEWQDDGDVGSKRWAKQNKGEASSLYNHEQGKKSEDVARKGISVAEKGKQKVVNPSASVISVRGKISNCEPLQNYSVNMLSQEVNGLNVLSQEVNGLNVLSQAQTGNHQVQIREACPMNGGPGPSMIEGKAQRPNSLVPHCCSLNDSPQCKVGSKHDNTLCIGPNVPLPKQDTQPKGGNYKSKIAAARKNNRSTKLKYTIAKPEKKTQPCPEIHVLNQSKGSSGESTSSIKPKYRFKCVRRGRIALPLNQPVNNDEEGDSRVPPAQNHIYGKTSVAQQRKSLRLKTRAISTSTSDAMVSNQKKLLWLNDKYKEARKLCDTLN